VGLGGCVGVGVGGVWVCVGVGVGGWVWVGVMLLSSTSPSSTHPPCPVDILTKVQLSFVNWPTSREKLCEVLSIEWSIDIARNI
jgi:hypothetical protein